MLKGKERQEARGTLLLPLSCLCTAAPAYARIRKERSEGMVLLLPLYCISREEYWWRQLHPSLKQGAKDPAASIRKRSKDSSSEAKGGSE